MDFSRLRYFLVVGELLLETFLTLVERRHAFSSPQMETLLWLHGPSRLAYRPYSVKATMRFAHRS